MLQKRPRSQRDASKGEPADVLAVLSWSPRFPPPEGVKQVKRTSNNDARHARARLQRARPVAAVKAGDWRPRAIPDKHKHGEVGGFGHVHGLEVAQQALRPQRVGGDLARAPLAASVVGVAQRSLMGVSS